MDMPDVAGSLDFSNIPEWLLFWVAIIGIAWYLWHKRKK